jgi:hypothetical protein
MVRICFLILFSFVLSIGCKLRGERLKISRENNHSNKLRLSGYYYAEFDGKNNFTVLFLYRNGVLYRIDNYWSDLKVIESRVLNGFYATILDNPAHWGIYVIRNNQILIDRWDYGGLPKPHFYGIGTIINDTTFLGGEAFEGRDTFHFKAFPIKPDSTNKFIK